jgi:signal transduction histidine kinase
LAFLLTGMSRTKHLVEQMLTYSRISVDAQGEPEVVVNLAEELTYLVSSQQTTLEGSSLQIQLDVPEQPLQVKAQRGLLEILLRNLLDNACKHSSNPDEPVRVSLQVEPGSQHASIRFSNSALPIPQQEVPRLFEPYYRPADTRAKGNGLGLAIAREAQEGVEFSVELPLNHPVPGHSA